MTETLDEWIERLGFKDLEDQWICHAKQYTKKPEDLVRLIFISMRQEFQESANHGVLVMFPYVTKVLK